MHASGNRRGDDATLGAGVSRRLVVLLSVACGTAVANLYYAQPLLQTLGRAFGVSDGTAGLLVTVGQVGYVLGLSLLVPLGDLRERRGLICALLSLTAAALVLAAAAPSFAVLAVAIGLVGVTAVAAQIIVPMASCSAWPRW
jgi:predicted MFS family arabinose efflux permease